MRQISEARLKRAEKYIKQRAEDRTFILDLKDDEMELLLSAAKNSGLDPDRMVARLVRNWLNGGSE